MNLKPIAAAILAASLSACVSDSNDSDEPTASQTISLKQQGSYSSGIFDQSAAEIVAFDAETSLTFVVNANSGQIDVLTSSDITNPIRISSLDIATDMVAAGDATGLAEVGAANSVAIYDGLIAIAVEAGNKTNDGWAVFYSIEGLAYVDAVQVGSLPDMLTFSPDGSQLVVANEGEPNDDYSIDPEGTVSILDITWDGTTLGTVKTDVGFTDFNVGQARNGELTTDNMILDGYSDHNADSKATIAESFEPEYISISEDGAEAFVALQENNAVAVINLTTKIVDRIIGLGFKDHSLANNSMDASQKDGVNIQSWPVMGMYMPDSIATMSYNGDTYILTANEGDDRQDWLDNVVDQTSCEAAGYFFGDDGDGARCIDAFSAKDFHDDNGTDTVITDDNVTLVDDLGNAYNATNGGFGEDNELRRLKFSYHTTFAMNGSTDFEKLYAYGGRSFSIYNATTGEQVFDSGNDFETKTAEIYAEDFNNDNAENTGDDRSDNKGPEPEAIALGTINGYTYAFIGLERMGGVMVYDVTNPTAPKFIEYVNNRDVTVDQITLEAGGAGDLGPEGFKFVDASDSPSGKPLLIVANEVSGTTTFYNIEVSTTEE